MLTGFAVACFQVYVFFSKAVGPVTALSSLWLTLHLVRQHVSAYLPFALLITPTPTPRLPVYTHDASISKILNKTPPPPKPPQLEKYLLAIDPPKKKTPWF